MLGSRTFATYLLRKIAPGLGVGHAIVGVATGRNVGNVVAVGIGVSVEVGDGVGVGIGVIVKGGVGVSNTRVGSGVNNG